MSALRLDQNVLTSRFVDCREFHMLSILVLLVFPDDGEPRAQTGCLDEEFM
jgi:hypothetical protein